MFSYILSFILLGGHPHEWKAVSGICIALLQEFVYKLNEYSFAAAAAPESKSLPPKSKYY